MAWHFAPPGVPLEAEPVGELGKRYKVVALAWNDDYDGDRFNLGEIRYLVHKGDRTQHLTWIDGTEMPRLFAP